MSFVYFERRARPVIEERWSREVADRVLGEAERVYPEIVAKLPNIGGWRNAFTPVMTVNGWLIALHHGMKADGKSAEDTISVSFEVSDRFLRTMPGAVLAGIGRFALSAPVRALFRRQAARSQRREYPADFVYRIEETPDGEFSFVFSECAVNKTYDALGLADLKPYCNFFDVTYSRLMNMGVDAEVTIGRGCDHCALRFKHGRKTEVPRPLVNIVPATTDG